MTDDVKVSLYTIIGLIGLVGLCVAVFAMMFIIAMKKHASGLSCYVIALKIHSVPELNS